MEKDKKNKRKEYLAEYREKNKDVRITFSNTDYTVLEKIATKQGLTLPQFIRLATMAQAKNLYLFPKEIEEQVSLAVQNMRGIGNNINQIARYCNAQHYSSPAYLENAFNHLRDMEKEIKNLKLVINDK